MYSYTIMVPNLCKRFEEELLLLPEFGKQIKKTSQSLELWSKGHEHLQENLQRVRRVQQVLSNLPLYSRPLAKREMRWDTPENLRNAYQRELKKLRDQGLI